MHSFGNPPFLLEKLTISIAIFNSSMGISASQNVGTVPYKAIFFEDIRLHRPYIGLIYDRYLRFRILKWPLNSYDSYVELPEGISW